MDIGASPLPIGERELFTVYYFLSPGGRGMR